MTLLSASGIFLATAVKVSGFSHAGSPCWHTRVAHFISFMAWNLLIACALHSLPCRLTVASRMPQRADRFHVRSRDICNSASIAILAMTVCWRCNPRCSWYHRPELVPQVAKRCTDAVTQNKDPYP